MVLEEAATFKIELRKCVRTRTKEMGKGTCGKPGDLSSNPGTHNLEG